MYIKTNMLHHPEPSKPQKAVTVILDSYCLQTSHIWKGPKELREPGSGELGHMGLGGAQALGSF